MDCKGYLFGILMSVLILIPSLSLGQDLVVTTLGDSLNVTITSVKKRSLEWSKIVQGRSVSFSLPMTEVSFFQRDYFSRLAWSKKEKPPVATEPLPEVSAPPSDLYLPALYPVFSDPPPSPRKLNYPKIRAGLRGGYSMLTAISVSQYSSVARSHINKLRHGYHFGADFAYFPGKHIGVGVMYGLYGASAQTDNVYGMNLLTGQIGVGPVIDNINMHFIGPSLNSRFFTGRRGNSLNLDFSMGYVHYVNNASFVDRFRFDSSTFGFSFSAGVDRVISRNITVGLGVSYAYAVLDHFDVQYGNTNRKISLSGDNRQNMSRLELSLVLRWSYRN
jgi:hypothetical protein